MLEDGATEDDGVNDGRPGARFRGLLLLPLVAIVAAAVYWQLGAAADVRIAQLLDTIDENTPRDELERVIGAIESRTAQRPDNLSYLALLGRYHMSREDFATASQIYASLAERAPEDPQALAMAAQSAFLAAGRELRPPIQRLAERALAIDPMQRTALGLLGMAAFEQGQYRGAISYWERLLALESPDSQGAQLLEEVIASARARLDGDEAPLVAQAPDGVHSGGMGADGAAATGISEEAAGPGIEVRISGPEDGELGANDTVFVLARGVNASGRMPVAVQRFVAGRLPSRLRLDDSHSMAGQKLSQAGEVRVFVQVSPDGRPGAENASFTGSSEPVTAGADAEVTVQLRRNTG
jgi:cytochrome c-type biogenesis protein CcmH